MAHATVSGNIHFVAENDAHAVQITRKLLVLPALEQRDGPAASSDPAAGPYAGSGMNDLVPAREGSARHVTR
jgi:propionyl-CoA carboxylase beta chain